MSERTLSALDALLARERDALRAGDLDSLADLAGEKERLVAALESDPGPVDPERWRAVRARAERNGRLLESARAGMKAAEERVAAIRRAHESLETYDATGMRRDLATPRARHARRA